MGDKGAMMGAISAHMAATGIRPAVMQVKVHLGSDVSDCNSSTGGKPTGGRPMNRRQSLLVVESLAQSGLTRGMSEKLVDTLVAEGNTPQPTGRAVSPDEIVEMGQDSLPASIHQKSFGGGLTLEVGLWKVKVLLIDRGGD